MLPRDDKAAFEIRANAGDGPDCDVNPVNPLQLTTPLPPDPPCDAPVVPDEEIFFKPPSAPTPQRSSLLPAPLRVVSPAVNLNCPPGQSPQVPPALGEDDYESPYGAFQRSFYLGDIEVDGEPLFTSSMLTSLAGVAGSIQAVITGASGFLNASAPSLGPDLPTSIATRAAYITSGLPARITEVMQITKLPQPVVEVLWNYILEQQGILDDEVVDRGQRALRCGYFNQDLWVLCYDFEDGEYTFQTTDPSDPDAVFLEAGTTFSLTSQADANALALLTAADVPACSFANELVEIDCDELFPGGDYSPLVTFRWPRDHVSNPEITIDDIGAQVSINEAGVATRTESALLPNGVLTYSEVLANGVAAERRKLTNRVSVAPGAVTGRTQDEANEKARALAISYLDCFIPSREQELKCTDEVVNVHAYDQAGGSEATETSVQEVLSEIVTGYTTLFSELSDLRPDNITFLPGPAIDERVAVRLFVPAGAFVGDSHIDAESSANGYTLASIATKMDCDWRSRSVTYACDDSLANYAPTNHLTDTEYVGYVGAATAVTYLGPYEIELKEGRMTIVPYPPYSLQGGGAIEMMASVANSTPYLVNSERGLFSSSTSQADADLIAAANAVSQLDCVYCNPEIVANCPPASGEEDSYDTTSGAPGVPYYFDEGLDRWRIVSELDFHVPPYTHHPFHAEGLVPSSYDPEPFICGDPDVVIAVAGESGRTPTRLLTTSVECRECNDFLTAACCQPPAPPGGDTPEISIITFSPDQCVDLIQDYEASNSGADCGGAGSGGAGSNPTNVVSIPECTVFASTKEEANALAANIITASLNCFFVNDECVRECANPCAGTESAPFSVVVNGNTHESVHQALCEGEGTATAVVARGLFRSNCSKEQANEQACSLAEAQLSCVWVNAEQTAECPLPQGGDHYHPDAILSATVEAGAIVSVEGCCAADVVALRTAALQLYCVFGNDRLVDPCLPRARPRILKETDNCGCVHTFPCGLAVGGEDEPFGESPTPSVVEMDVVVSPVSTAAANVIAAGLITIVPCQWVNLPVDVECCDFDVEGNIPSEDAVMEVFIPEGEFTGETMCDATEQAFRVAVTQLFCEYTNATQIAECPPLEEGDHYHPDAIVLVTVEEGTLVGCRSTAEYNNLAMDMAMAQLYCIFGNDEQNNAPGCTLKSRPRILTGTDNCGGSHTERCGVAAGGSDEPLDGGFPPIMFIQADIVTSTISTAAANVIARGLLETPQCSWVNNEIDVGCEDKGVAHSSAVLAVNIPQGTVIADTMCDATEQAFRMAVAQLQCLWTNERQEVNDCPNGFQLVEGGEGVVETDTLIQCSTELANAIALAMAKAQVQCKPTLFGNAEVTRSECPGDDEGDEFNRRWELKVSGVVFAGEVQSTTQESADAIAESLVLLRTICAPKLNCNPLTAYGQRDGCPGAPSAPQYCPQTFVGGETICAYGFLPDELQVIAQMLADAQTFCCPEYNTAVTGNKSCGPEGVCVYGEVAAGLIPSYDPDDGVAKATAIAQGIADAQTFCCPKVYFNTAVTGTKSCDSEGICVTGEVVADSIPSWNSEEEATAIAQGIANALTVCCSDIGGGDLGTCPAGSLLYSDGAETWQCLGPPTGTGLHVLGCTVGGIPGWIETDACS
jgi:hypothetical protein